jgi:hypothetical protein
VSTSIVLATFNFHRGRAQKLVLRRLSPFLTRLGRIKKWCPEFKRSLGGYVGRRFQRERGQVDTPNPLKKVALDVIIRKIKCINYSCALSLKQHGVVFPGTLELNPLLLITTLFLIWFMPCSHLDIHK